MTRREQKLVCAAIVGGLLVVAWSALRFVDARDSALTAAHDLGESRRLAEQIAQQRVSGVSVSASAPKDAELIRWIESAARSAELPQASIDRIVPGPSERIHETGLTEKSTIVQLKQVTLRQLFAFFHAMSTGQAGLSVKQVRLSVPSADDTGDRWSVESTLVYLVRTPADEQRASVAD